MEDFLCAAKIYPHSSLPLFKRGVAHYRECEEEEALRDIQRVLDQLFPTDPTVGASIGTFIG